MNAFQFKISSFTLPIMKWLHINWENISEEIQQILATSPKLFQNTPIILDLSEWTEKEPIDLAKLINLLRLHHLHPAAIRTSDETLILSALSLNLGILPPIPSKEKIDNKDENEPNLLQAKSASIISPQSLIIEHPVRSGQQIYAAGGDLIILAPVSPGAEILADGNIHIYGPLRGRVYAGFSGNINARIFCQSLAAEFISIAGRYLICEHLDYGRVQSATQIYLQDDQLKIASLSFNTTPSL